MTDAAHKSLAEALAAFQAEEGLTFSKTKTAKVQTRNGGEYSYSYADLSDILPVVRPLLAKHGLSWNSKPGRHDDGTLLLCFALRHSSGELDEGAMALGVDAGCKPQEMGSAITYARRYALTAQLNLATEDDDDGNAASRTKTSSPAAPKEPLASKTDIDAMAFAGDGLSVPQIKTVLAGCGLADVNSYAQVPHAKVGAVTQALKTAERTA